MSIIKSPAQGYGSIVNANKLQSPYVAPGIMFLQEKIDGSQFRFRVIDGELRCWSRGRQLNVTEHNHDKLFASAVESAKRLAALLPEGHVFCAEAMASRRHNIVQYDRAPSTGMVLFDVWTPQLGYADHMGVSAWGDALGLEVAPYIRTFGPGQFINIPALVEETRSAVSMLGGPVEGFVLKALDAVDRFGGLVRWKIINPSFSETKVVKKATSQHAELFEIGKSVATAMRWQKAVNRLREKGLLRMNNSDIGQVIKEIQADIEKEELDVIKARLWVGARKDIFRGALDGFPGWYQAQLATGGFDAEPSASRSSDYPVPVAV